MNTELAPAESPKREQTSSRNAPSRYISFREFQLDLKRQELLKNGSRIRLQGKAYEALLTLLERPGELVTRQELRIRLWSGGTHVDYDANVNTTVNKLRQVLGDSSEQAVFIETIPRKGYSFVAQVVYQDHPAVRDSQVHGEDSLTPQSAGLPQTEAASRVSLSRDSKMWFIAGMIALGIAAILLGAAITLFTHRAT